MKTLYKTYQFQSEAMKKAKEQSLKYGCDFTFYSTGDGYNIRPCLNMKTQKSESKNVEIVTKLLQEKTKKYMFSGISFTMIMDDTGLSILEVLECAKYMIDNQLAILDIGRSGKVIGMHIKK